VIIRTRRRSLLLRISLLGLTLLTVVGRPLYSTWCETHQLGHELASFNHEVFRQDSSSERALDADHASGGHGMLHASDQATYADIASAVTVPDVHFDSVPHLVVTELPDPVQRISRLFRPPIA
jgi:hypothetical protein